MVSSASSSSSCRIPRSVYDVFLSFHGADTRTSFTSHLLAALDQHGFSTFRDDTKLPRGKPISSELLKAIEESRVSIVVFSKNFAASRWCLDELVKIMECRRDFNKIVLPIFCNVDPAHVRAQLGSYSEAFSMHEDQIKEGSSSMERVETWRAALTEAANLAGYDLQRVANGDEAGLINEIVKDMDTFSFRRLDGGRSWLRMSKSSPTTSNGSWSSRNNGVPLEDMYCGCGIKVPLKTSWTKNNPGRRFWACPKYRKEGCCRFFRWLDDELCPRSKQIIMGLLVKINKDKAEIERLKVKE